MTEQMSKQRSDGQLTREKRPRLQLTDIVLLTRHAIMEFRQSQSPIRQICELFSNQGDIESSECDYLLSSLRTSRSTLQNLQSVFQDTDALPITIVPFCHPFVAELSITEACIQRLTHSTKLFRSTCQTISTRAIRHQCMIIDDLEALLELNESIVFQAQSLLDTIRFLERQP
jgi:hypothetical protein